LAETGEQAERKSAGARGCLVVVCAALMLFFLLITWSLIRDAVRLMRNPYATTAWSTTESGVGGASDRAGGQNRDLTAEREPGAGGDGSVAGPPIGRRTSHPSFGFYVFATLMCLVGAGLCGLGVVVGLGQEDRFFQLLRLIPGPPGRRARVPVAAQTQAGIRLKSRSSSWRAWTGLAVFTLIWDGFLSVFLLVALSNPPKGGMPLGATIILGVFVLVGTLMLWSVISQASSLLNLRRPTVEIDRVPLRPGGQVRVTVRIPGPLTCDKLGALLIAEEGVKTVGRDSDGGLETTYTTAQRHEEKLLDLGSTSIGEGETIERIVDVHLPAELSRRAWSWAIRVRGKGPGNRVFAYEFLIDEHIEA
jgi:hypothetical protein